MHYCSDLRKDLNILIVDDELNSRELLSFLLINNFNNINQIYEFENTSDALQIINQKHFDIVFTDSKMPFEYNNNLPNKKQNKKIQWVLCTALNNKEFANSFDYPMYFLQKPVDIEDFKTICQLIKDQLNAFENTLII